MQIPPSLLLGGPVLAIKVSALGSEFRITRSDEDVPELRISTYDQVQGRDGIFPGLNFGQPWIKLNVADQ